MKQLDTGEMPQSSENRYFIDYEALALRYYVVVDKNNKPIKEFDSYNGAIQFITTVCHMSQNEVSETSARRGDALSQYKRKFIEARKKKRSGWAWKDVPEEIKQRPPAPPSREKYESQYEYEEALDYWRSRVGRNVALAMSALNKS